VLAVLAGVSWLWYTTRELRQVFLDEDAPPAAGWMDTLRARARLPDLSDLMLARTDTGDASLVLYDTTVSWKAPAGLDSAYAALVGPRRAVAADSALWHTVAADTSLDRLVAAARRREWRAFDHSFRAQPGTAQSSGFSFWTMPIPRYSRMPSGAQGLALRAAMRVGRGNRAGARTDLAAALGLGEHIVREEPYLIGGLIGRRLIRVALRGYADYAAVTRDTALGRHVAELRARSDPRSRVQTAWLATMPESALAFAADTTVPLGWRTEAVAVVVGRALTRPRSVLFGAPRQLLTALDSLAGGSAGDISKVIAYLRHDVEWYNRSSPRGRWRALTGR
jgi:hypothetical protein